MTNSLLADHMPPTGAKNRNSRNKNWLANMTMKYIVASRRMESKTLGMSGCLFVLNLLAVTTMIKNAKMSTMPQRGECGV